MDTKYGVSVSLVNEDEGYIFSEWTEDLEDWLLDDNDRPNFGEVYRIAQREYGRCTSSVYVDRDGKAPARVGWFFASRQQYEDTGKPYLRGAWVTVVTIPAPVFPTPVILGELVGA